MSQIIMNMWVYQTLVVKNVMRSLTTFFIIAHVLKKEQTYMNYGLFCTFLFVTQSFCAPWSLNRSVYIIKCKRFSTQNLNLPLTPVPNAHITQKCKTPITLNTFRTFFSKKNHFRRTQRQH